MAAAGFTLSVFQEFAATADKLAALQQVVAVDKAAEANKLAKSPEERQMVAQNAKLFFEPELADADVDAVLAKLSPLGLAVVHRKPVTSTGFPMRGRVILRLEGVPLPAADVAPAAAA